MSTRAPPLATHTASAPPAASVAAPPPTPSWGADAQIDHRGILFRAEYLNRHVRGRSYDDDDGWTFLAGYRVVPEVQVLACYEGLDKDARIPLRAHAPPHWPQTGSSLRTGCGCRPSGSARSAARRAPRTPASSSRPKRSSRRLDAIRPNG